MRAKTHSTQQSYWRHDDMPHVELRSTWHSSQSYRPHSHAQLSIGAIIEGATRISCHGKQCIAGTGDLVLIEPRQLHSCNPLPGSLRSYYMLFLDAAWCLDRLSDLCGRSVQLLQCTQVCVRSPGFFDIYLQIVHALNTHQIKVAIDTLDQLCFALFNRYITPTKVDTSSHPITLQAKQRLLNSLTEPPTLQSLAAELGCRPETLSRLFKRDMGLSPKAFLNNARIEKARNLLRAGAHITEAAAATGFVDQSHFHRTFVDHTASTPRQYQQRQSKKYNI